MSKFKNKKALTLAVGAIMAGVSVIGVVAACAPTKAKPNKPSQGTQNPSQSGGAQSTNPGSGSNTTPTGQGSNNGGTTKPTDQGSNNGGTTNPTDGSSKTSPEKTQPSTPETTPKNDNGTSGDNKQNDKSKEMMQGDVSTPGSQNGEQPKVESGDGKTENDKTEQPIEGSDSQSGKKTEEGNSQTETGKPQTDPQANRTENQQSDSQAGKKADEGNSQAETGQPQTNSTENTQPGKKVEDPDKQKEIDLKSKLTLVTFSRQQSYFWLRLNTSKETFDKLKDGRLKFLLDKGNGTFEEQASLFEQGGRKAYYVNDKVEADGSVSFSISSDQPYGGNQNEKGKYKVTQIWLLGDDSKNNLLNQNNKTVDVQ